MTAVLEISQATAPASSGPGFSYTTGVINQLVTIDSVGTATTHEARILMHPDDDAVTLTQVTGKQWTFTPNPSGGIPAGGAVYRIELVTDRGLPSEARQIRVFGIRDSNGFLIPPFGTQADPLANIPDLTDSVLFNRYLQASELNEPDATYPDGRPFGWAKEIRALLAAGAAGGGNLQTGSKLWEWNKTDLSQFEATALPHGGGTANAATALIASVVSGGQPYDKVLRLTATALQGGGVFAVLASELTLPDRYVVRVVYADDTSSVGQIVPTLYLAFTPDDGGGDLEGYGLSRRTGLSNVDLRAFVNNVAGSADSLGSSGTFFTPTLVDRGGIEDLITIEKNQNGETPSYVRLSVEDRGGGNNDIAYERSLVHTISGVSTNWDGLTFDRFGPGAYEGVLGTTGSCDFAAIEVYAHPGD
jgi:hypothetical protein